MDLRACYKKNNDKIRRLSKKVKECPSSGEYKNSWDSIWQAWPRNSSSNLSRDAVNDCLKPFLVLHSISNCISRVKMFVSQITQFCIFFTASVLLSKPVWYWQKSALNLTIFSSAYWAGWVITFKTRQNWKQMASFSHRLSEEEVRVCLMYSR